MKLRPGSNKIFRKVLPLIDLNGVVLKVEPLRRRARMRVKPIVGDLGIQLFK